MRTTVVSIQNDSPLLIREKARAVALKEMGAQMSAFKRWGVTADWKRPYLTMNADYVANQLNIFADINDRGLVYRAFKPVFWYDWRLTRADLLLFAGRQARKPR